MFVSVVIPTYNKSKRLNLTLLSLCKQSYPHDKFEIIVVDDGSDDGTREVVQSVYSEIKARLIYKYQENSGRSAARNTGINFAEGELIIFLDDDRLVSEDFIKQHVSTFLESQRSDISVVGKKMNLYMSRFDEDFEAIKSVMFNNSAEIIKKARSDYYYRKAKEALKYDATGWILFTTGNVSIKKDVLKHCGMFNESFKGWGLEDTELGYRLWKNGITFLVNEEAVNYHIEHARNPLVKKQDEDRNHELFYKIHPELPVKLFRSFVDGKISIEEFNARICGEREEACIGGNIFYSAMNLYE